MQRGVLWVGTDDGNLQVTQDGGKTWTNVIERIPDVPKNTWIPHVEASKFDAGAAYAIFDDHRRSNWKTYVFKTEDFGKSWKSLTKSDPTTLISLRQAESVFEEALRDFNKAFSEAVPVYKAKVEQAKLSLFPEGDTLDVNWRPIKKE